MTPAPVGITWYDVVKDLGFPIVVTLILLFQIGPKLEEVAQTNVDVARQLGAVSATCLALKP